MSTRKYPRYAIVGVGAVVFKGDKVLLVKRGRDPGKGLWSFPGGVVNAGETLRDAVLRELYEETGLRGNVLKLVQVEEVIVRENRTVKYHYVVLYYLVEASGFLRQGGDAEEVKWIKIEEALASSRVSSVVKRVLRRLVK
ncbi:MAG TPA: NUDIX domain-containing protein [Thermoprotei archaeon]|nr:MAG: hypothetical protein DRJ49_04775 [Thermoprotei archaeon]HDI75600.1 NUDIX domain-containing protein [Thermoprotei archaeon]